MKYRLLGACVAATCFAAPAFAQGLTRVELLGLQQQLRDDGCGVTHVTGKMDAMTRAAVKKCQSKYSGATDARSMLAAMHIGFENGNSDPTLSQARAAGSMSAGGASGSMNAGTSGRMRRGRMRDSTMNRGMNGGMIGGMYGTRMRVSTTNGGMNGMRMRDSTGRMRRGRMRDSTMTRPRDTSTTRGSGGMVDTDKSSPMTPTTPSTPVPGTNPSNPVPPTSPPTKPIPQY